jgi:hypothetical protein
MKVGDRVRIKKAQPWAGEYGTYLRDEITPVGMLYRIKLDNGVSVLQKRNNFIVLEGNFKYPLKKGV